MLVENEAQFENRLVMMEKSNRQLTCHLFQSFCASQTSLYSAKTDEVKLAHCLSVGTVVEFEEGSKSRTHIGTIKSSTHKSSGGARYKIEDTEGKIYDIADKAVTFSTPGPNNPGKVEKLLKKALNKKKTRLPACC